MQHLCVRQQTSIWAFEVAAEDLRGQLVDARGDAQDLKGQLVDARGDASDRILKLEEEMHQTAEAHKVQVAGFEKRAIDRAAEVVEARSYKVKLEANEVHYAQLVKDNEEQKKVVAELEERTRFLKECMMG